MKTKTADAYFIDILTKAIEGKLPDQISSDSTISLYEGEKNPAKVGSYLVELIDEGYLDGNIIDTSSMDEGKSYVVLHPAITIRGREYLDELKAKKPFAKIKAKGAELGWLIITNLVTAIISAGVGVAIGWLWAKHASP